MWYVPGVAPGSDLDSYLVLFNPSAAAASVTVNYVTPGAEAVVKTYTVPSVGRVTLRVSDEVKGKQVDAALVRSSQPIVAERVTMFKTTVGATSSAGIPGR